MNSENKLMRKIPSGLLWILIVISVCSEREWKNIYDPEGSNPAAWAPQTFMAQQISDRRVRLVWEQFDERIDGFHLSRKIGDQAIVEKFGTFDPDLRAWSDTIFRIGQTQFYELTAFADQAVSAKMSVTFIPVFTGPDIAEIIHLSASAVQLTWEAHAYPTVSHYRVERRINGSAFEMMKQTGNNFVYDSTLNPSETYTYRISAITDLNTSEPGETAQIHWDQVGYEPCWSSFLPYYHGKPAPDGMSIAAWKQDELSLYDTETGALRWTVDPGQYYPSSVLFSPDNTFIVSITHERFFKVWNVTGQERWTGMHANIANNKVVALDISADALKIASGDYHSRDQTAELRVWKSSDGSVLWTQTMPRSISALVFSADHSKLACGDLAGNVSVWNVTGSSLVWTVNYPDAAINQVQLSHDGSKLVVCTTNDRTQVYRFYVTNSTNGNALFSGRHGWSVSSVVFNRDDTSLLTSSYDDSLRIWNTTTGQQIYARYGGPPAYFSPDETKIIAGGKAGLRVYNRSDGTLFWKTDTLGYSWNTEFVGDGRRLVSSSESGLMVWTERYGWKRGLP